MREKKATNQKLTSWPGDIPVTSLYTAGIAGDEFFGALRNKGELLGSRCNRCEITYVPARMFCERCFSRLPENITVPQHGEVVTWTTCHVDLDGKRLQKPVTVAAVKLEGAGTVFIHYLDPKIKEPRIGMKVRAAVKPKNKRTGSILDIEYFTANQ